ncbi:pre-mRNA-splicing factor SLU7-like [Aptenodytes patagonicus]|uniref:pre-mRNA-splicing factor SLU7-like n=1 Tax=Aptenodytes patagonicus TaxID=9234 RepID=UPI003F9FF151
MPGYYTSHSQPTRARAFPQAQPRSATDGHKISEDSNKTAKRSQLGSAPRSRGRSAAPRLPARCPPRRRGLRARPGAHPGPRRTPPPEPPLCRTARPGQGALRLPPPPLPARPGGAAALPSPCQSPAAHGAAPPARLLIAAAGQDGAARAGLRRGAYLRNLDPNSAYYDPKTRAMRENPYANTGKNPDEVGYAGDNFVRYTGDTISMAQTQLFAWEAYDKGSEVHLQADPTKLELLYKSFKVKKEDFKAQQKESILEKYGGQEHLDAPPAELLLAQTEDYVEYSRHGTVIKGQEKAIACSKYEEDVKINNHTCIWGSYWKEGKWGYKCCHSFVKYSYCTGEAGKEIANTEASLLEEQPGEEEHMTKPKTLMEIHQEKQKEKKKKKHKKSSNSDSEGEEKKKQEKLKKALNAEEARLLHVKEIMQLDERKRPYISVYETREPTEEEMEAYRMKRQRPDDPMASFLGQ